MATQEDEAERVLRERIKEAMASLDPRIAMAILEEAADEAADEWGKEVTRIR